MSYLTWDIETTTHTSFKRKANMFDARNSIVMQGYKRKGGKVESDYFGRNKLPFDWFTKLLAGTRILVGMNIKFDILYALREQQNLEAWMDWVAGGGQVWDIQLAEYLLNGMFQEEQMLSLDIIAPRYGGNVKFDEVKAMWEAGIDTLDIPEDLLHKYLVGTETEHGDIGNTELVFLAQLEVARKRGQVKSILLNMGSLIATIEMERNGMKVDTEKAEVLRIALAAKVAEVKEHLNQFLPADLPFEFKWTNRYHLSPLIFGGQVKYEIKDYILDEQGNRTYPQKKELHYVFADPGDGPETVSVDEYTTWLNSGSPGQKYPDLLFNKSGKNAGEPKTKQVTVPDTDRPKMKIFERVYIFPQMTAPKKQWASSTPGLYSVAAEVIEQLEGRGVAFLDQLVKVAKWSKDLGTYYWTEDEDGTRKGMLTLLQDGIIHHKLNHTSTVTARFSSSDPNLQNIPRGDKSDVKTIFVSRFPDGVIVQSDFTSLEVYVQAILTKCHQLITDLRAGLDMHCVRVSAKEGCTYEEALLWCKGKGKEVPPREGWPEKRTAAKEFSFQRAYGAGADAISKSTGIPVEDVKALIKAESERYPEIDSYYLRKTAQIEASRIPTSRFVKHPDNAQITCQLGRGLYTEPDGKVYGYQESPTPKFILERYGKTQGFSPTEIRNYGVQGGGGEWAKAALWLAVRAYYKRRNFGGLALLVNQVHDAVYGDNDKSVTFEASALLHACMEGASDLMEWYFGWPCPVPVPSVTEAGPSMGEADELNDPEWIALARKFRLELRAEYMSNYQPSFEKENA